MWGRQRERDRVEREAETDLLELICLASSSAQQSGKMMEVPKPTDLLPLLVLLVTMASHGTGVLSAMWGHTPTVVRASKGHQDPPAVI